MTSELFNKSRVHHVPDSAQRPCLTNTVSGNFRLPAFDRRSCISYPHEATPRGVENRVVHRSRSSCRERRRLWPGRGIGGEPLGLVEILAAGEQTEHRWVERSAHVLACVLATAASKLCDRLPKFASVDWEPAEYRLALSQMPFEGTCVPEASRSNWYIS